MICAYVVQAFNAPSDVPFGGCWIRESEKKHGRAAMVALPSFLGLMSGGVADPVSWLNSQPLQTQLVFYSGCAVLESFNLRRMSYPFKMKPEVEPGRVLPIARITPSLDVLEDTASRACMVFVFLMMLYSVDVSVLNT